MRAGSSGPAAQTDASGNFTMTGAPTGNVELQFTRADINARGPVVLASGPNSVTASITGGTAVITPRGHAGEEIEGRVVSVNLANGTLIVQDQRLGNANVTVSVSTIIRKGNTSLTLSAIGNGFQVHVKAVQQGDGTYIATEIVIQDDKEGGEGEATGSVASVNSSAASFVVTTVSGPVTVRTNSSTNFKKKGSNGSFSDIAVGVMVEAEGTLQSDSSILATKVTIE